MNGKRVSMGFHWWGPEILESEGLFTEFIKYCNTA